jgi:hypothetical protein
VTSAAFPEFGDLLGSFFVGLGGSYPEPPDSVPLRLLGLTEKPASQAAVKAAFRARVMVAHPDIGAYTTMPAEVNAAVEAHAMADPDVQELVWARDVLLRKIPATVTASNRGPMGSFSRYEPSRCKVCNGDRLDSRGRPYGLHTSEYGRRKRWIGYCVMCARDAENERQRQQRAAARADRTCAHCGRRFTPARSDGRYCKPAHRQAAYRQRTRGGVS